MYSMFKSSKTTPCLTQCFAIQSTYLLKQGLRPRSWHAVVHEIANWAIVNFLLKLSSLNNFLVIMFGFTPKADLNPVMWSKSWFYYHCCWCASWSKHFFALMHSFHIIQDHSSRSFWSPIIVTVFHTMIQQKNDMKQQHTSWFIFYALIKFSCATLHLP